jgi:hypothetical protein
VREKIGRAIHSSDLSPHEWECALDRVAALGAAGGQGDATPISDADLVFIGRLGALGSRGTPNIIGAELWRLKYGRDAHSFTRAAWAIVRMTEPWFRKKKGILKSRIRMAIVRQALREYLDPQCSLCRGAGECKNEANGLLIVCPQCGGHKVRRYTDDERAKALDSTVEEYRKRYASKLAHISGIISHADLVVGREIIKQLEKERT